MAGLRRDDELRGGGGGDTYLVGGPGRPRRRGGGPGERRGLGRRWDYELPAHVERLFLDGAAAWGSGNELDNRVVGNDLDNRLVGGRAATP
jgi:hypothetical protein